MSGHSKWSTIKRQKGATDIKRGLAFTKVANTITLAAKLGNSADPNNNSRLRVALEQARSINMPKENIQRAIDRGLRRLPGQQIEEVVYEGFGPPVFDREVLDSEDFGGELSRTARTRRAQTKSPGGVKVAFYLEAVTDNKLRTNSEIRQLFERNGGVLGVQGSTAYMFDKKGEIKIKSKGLGSEEEILELIDIGVQDIEDYLEPFDSTQGNNIQKYLVYVESSELNTMGNKITRAGYEVESQEIVYKPNALVKIKDAETAKKVIEFTQKLEDHDDIQRVYTNFDVPKELI